MWWIVIIACVIIGAVMFVAGRNKAQPTKEHADSVTDPGIIGVVSSPYSVLASCPKCNESVGGDGSLCARCNLWVHKTHGMDVATIEDRCPAVTEIRNYLKMKQGTP